MVTDRYKQHNNASKKNVESLTRETTAVVTVEEKAKKQTKTKVCVLSEKEKS